MSLFCDVVNVAKYLFSLYLFSLTIAVIFFFYCSGCNLRGPGRPTDRDGHGDSYRSRWGAATSVRGPRVVGQVRLPFGLPGQYGQPGTMVLLKSAAECGIFLYVVVEVLAYLKYFVSC
jgi:hypothetical protein